MSTRATVWIRNDKDDESVFLFHHCDGYCLDEDIDPVLKNLPDDAWNVVDIQDAIQALEFGDTYRRVDTVGWDSEYVYKISIDEHKMYKYDTGIGDPYGDEANFESRLTDLERTYEYQPEKWEDEPKEELSPLAAKLKEIVDSYDEEHSMTWEGAEFYANQLRSMIENKKEIKHKLVDGPDPDDFQGMNAQAECETYNGDCTNCLHNIENKEKRFDKATQAKILQIQLAEIVKYCCRWLNDDTIPAAIPYAEIDRIQKLFKTLNEN